jgi:hypothetical protein
MPRMKVVNGRKVRDYSQQREYNASPDATAKRVANNQARRQAISSGKARVGDGTDVDHIRPQSKGGKNSKTNLRVVPSSVNRSFARNSDSSVKSQTSKRERKRK